MSEVKQNGIILSDGRVATIGEFKGKHIVKAQAISGGDAQKTLLAIVSVCVRIDGNGVAMEDLEEMDGFDVMKLISVFSGNFTPAESK